MRRYLRPKRAMPSDPDTQNEPQNYSASSRGRVSSVGMPAITPQAPTSKGPIYKAFAFWVYPFTRFHRIPVFKRVWLYLAFMAVYSFAVDVVVTQNFSNHLFKEAGAAGYTSVILGLLLVFRTNTAYERWWEGRKLWGQLVNDSRNLCLKVRTYVPTGPGDKAELGELIVSFAYALKHHLRDSQASRSLPGLGDIPEGVKINAPVHLAGKMYEKVLEWKREDLFDGFVMIQLDTHLRSFLDICGACERIKNSPLALSYRAFMRQGIALNLLALPWYIEPEFNYWLSLPLILIGSYFLIGLELIAEDIEEPFGKDGDDLPLDTICATIESTVNDILQLNRSQKFTTSFRKPRIDPLKETKPNPI